MAIETDSAAVLFHYPPTKEGQAPFERAKKGVFPHVLKLLNAEGRNVYFTRGLSSYGRESVETFDPVKPSPLQLDYGPVGVVRDIAGAFRHADSAAYALVESQDVPIINGPLIRQADNKVWAARQELFGDYHIPTSIIETVSGSALLEALGDLGCSAAYVKPANGTGNNGVHRVDVSYSGLDDEVERIAEEHRDNRLLVQSEVDNTVSLPASIKPLTDRDRAILRHPARKKELRISFWFNNDAKDENEVRWLPLVRAGQVGATHNVNDDQVFIDPESVPEEVIEHTIRSTRKLSEITGIDAFSGTVDYVWGVASGSSSKESRWWTLEGNFWQPVPPNRKLNADMHGRFIAATAAHLGEVASLRDPK